MPNDADSDLVSVTDTLYCTISFNLNGGVMRYALVRIPQFERTGRGENLVRNMHYLMYQPVNGKRKKSKLGHFRPILSIVALHFKSLNNPALCVTFSNEKASVTHYVRIE
jgi:hypothetical protein